MKVLNNEGRFQFIKNQQVKIDKTLKKYKELELVKKISPIRNASDDTESDSLGTPFSTINNSKVEVDDELRALIDGLSSNSIIEYLKSDDAKEFNAMFNSILTGEVNINKYSLSVTDARWNLEIPHLREDVEAKKFDSFKNVISLFFSNLNKAIKSTKKELNKEKKYAEDEIMVMDFFNTIHIMGNNEKAFINRIEGYFQLLENAKKMNQVAQIDDICQKIIIDIYESVLFANGYNKYIEFGEIENIKSEGSKW